MKLFFFAILVAVTNSTSQAADCREPYKDRSARKFLNIAVDFTESGGGSFQAFQNNLMYQNMAFHEYTQNDDDFKNRYEKLHEALALAAQKKSNPYLREKILDKITKKVGKDKHEQAYQLIGTWYKDGTLCPKVKDKYGKEQQSVLSRKAIIRLAIEHLKDKKN